MGLYTKLCIVLLGTCLSSLLLYHECKRLDGYEFPVYSTEFCPRNQEEWNLRSSAINCTNTNGYMCLPNDNLTELLEFCYIYPRMLIQKELCLYLVKRYSRVNSHNCSNFKYGCPEDNYFSSAIFQYPSCIHVENGCFFAEPSCKSKTTTYAPKTTSFKQTGNIQENTTVPFYHESTEQIQNENDRVLVATLYGVLLFIVFFCSLCIYFIIKKKSFRRKVRRGSNMKMDMNMHRSERFSLLRYERRETLENYKVPESLIEMAIFDQWEQDDSCFISTKACKEVEKIIRSRNLVIVAGHSGSGKSAIIQHIALKYREQGWTVRRIKKVEDIVNEYSANRFQKNKTMFVFNDPFGKESFDEILNYSWQTFEEELQLYLKTSKLVMSCRSHIISDTRVKHYLVNQSYILNIDENKYKLSVEEKRQILNKYTSDMNLSDKYCDKIVKVERYFPLLCKLYSSKEEYKNKGIGFFTEPVIVLKNEILWFRKQDKGKYCALALLVLFNGDLCVSELSTNKDTEYKFKHTLKLCGLPENIPPLAIADYLYSLKDCFVKKVGNTYHFYHDLVMEATSYVFGIDYPAETLKYADIGFLRRRVKLGSCDEQDESFTIYLSDRYIEELGERLYNELFGDRMLDVVLNPCLRNENVIKVLKKKITDYPENLQMLLETRKLTIDKHEFDRTSKSILMSKLKFLELDSKVSPLFALITFCHTQLSQYCVNILQKNQIDLSRLPLVSAMFCNGSKELFNNASNREEVLFNKTWGCLYPIHIVSVFHNYELLDDLIMLGVNVNQKTVDNGGWTALVLAVGNDTQENGDYNLRESGVVQRDKTVQLLLSNGADINLCREDGASPLYVACENRHDSTVHLLLSNGADINLCKENGASPLYVACQNGHDNTVQLLLSNGADIKFCEKSMTNPLHIACFSGHDSIVQLLLSNGADINFCLKNGASPLYVACQNGHESTVQLLLRNGADINLCNKNGASPLYVACENGNYSTVQLLLSNGADINFCKENGASPLNVACENGHDSTVQLLLSNGADINFCEKDMTIPLHIACFFGHNSTVQHLLNKGADINFCKYNGASPLYVACQNGHESTVQLLLRIGADINLCKENGASPLYVACQNGHDSTVQLLLSNGADINFCKKNGASPLYVACQNGHDSTVQLLLSNEADIIFA